MASTGDKPDHRQTAEEEMRRIREAIASGEEAENVDEDLADDDEDSDEGEW